VPFRIAWVAGALFELIYSVLHLPGEPYITRFLIESVSQSSWFKIEAAKRDLGYNPKIDTAEGLRRLEEWLRDKV
jgi:nucleoside-diphosphate-sugar epimerase